MGYGFLKDKTISEQVSRIRVKYNSYTVTSTHLYLKVLGSIKPTPRSLSYQFELKYYSADGIPSVRILSPVLIKNSKGEKIPHMYSNGTLCLYRPKYKEFNKNDFLADKIIPWTALWLYHYEVWHMTNDWMGGGEHPPQ